MPAAASCLIPAFGADGQRLRPYSLAAALRSESLHLVKLIRNRRAKILAVEKLPPEGCSGTRSGAHQGTKYSFLRRISEQSRCWELDIKKALDRT